MKYISGIVLVLITNVAFASGPVVRYYQEQQEQQDQQQQDQSSQDSNTVIYESGTNAAIVNPQAHPNEAYRAQDALHKGPNDAVQHRENFDRRRR